MWRESEAWEDEDEIDLMKGSAENLIQSGGVIISLQPPIVQLAL